LDVLGRQDDPEKSVVDAVHLFQETTQLRWKSNVQHCFNVGKRRWRCRRPHCGDSILLSLIRRNNLFDQFTP
jgi:hypothetical protein